MRPMTGVLLGAIVGAAVGPTDALAEADDDACKRGLAAYAAKNLVVAHLVLARCDSPEAAVARRKAGKVLSAGDYGPVSIAVEPDGANIELQPLGETFPSPQVVWLPFGTYRITAAKPGFESFTTEITLTDRSRYALPLRLRRTSGNGPGNQSVEFHEGETGGPAGGVVTARDPTPTKHKSLLPDRYARAPSPTPIPEQRGPPSRTLPWLTIGAGTTFMVGGAVAGVIAVRRDADRGVFASVGAIAVGAALTGTGLYLLRRKPKNESNSIAVGPVARGHGAMIFYSW